MKAKTMSRILVALALGSTLTGAHPDRLQCGQELAVGETIMGAAAQAETQFTYANFKLWRKDDPETQLYCTSEFHPGDELQVTLEMSTPDYKWLMTLEHDGFDGTTYARVLRLLQKAAARKDPFATATMVRPRSSSGRPRSRCALPSPRGTASLPSRSTASVVPLNQPIPPLAA